VRLSRRELRDHINCRKNDRWPSYRFYRALQADEIADAQHLQDFRSPAIFEFFRRKAASPNIGYVQCGMCYEIEMISSS
jgi:hypothetical protein